MSEDRDCVARRQVEITNALGLHLRPANKFVNLADRFQAEVRVHYKGRAFDGKSILELTSLAAEQGTRLDLEAWGPDAEALLSALAELISSEFNEDENGDERGPRPNEPPNGPRPADPATRTPGQSGPHPGLDTLPGIQSKPSP